MSVYVFEVIYSNDINLDLAKKKSPDIVGALFLIKLRLIQVLI